MMLKDCLKHTFPNLADVWSLKKYERAVYGKIRESLALKESDYRTYLEEFYLDRTGHQLNLDNPERFTEKIQWRKLYDRDIIYSLLSDKYRVREWVESRIGGEYLVPLLGHWEHFDEINFDDLPDQFVLKVNNGCHENIIVKDKEEFLRRKWSAKKKMEYWLRSSFFYYGLELHYGMIKPVIIAEEYLNPVDREDCLTDYKFHCFDGTPFVCQVIRGRTTKETLDFFDMDWKHLSIAHPSFPNNADASISRPQYFDLMIKLATKLSKGFQYVRVDLYSTNKVYFGEMTFTPANGTERYIPDEWDYQMGKRWNINTVQIDHSVVIFPRDIDHSLE